MPNRTNCKRLAAFRKALSCAAANLAVLLEELNRHDEALCAFRRAAE